MSKNKKLTKLIAWYLMMLILSVSVLVPLYLIITTSLKTKAESSVLTLSLPAKLRFENYATVFKDAHVGRSLMNSSVIAVSTVVVVIFVAAMAAFIIQRRGHQFRIFYYYLISGLLVPLSIIPEIQIMKFFHLNGTFLPIILVHIATNLPFAFFLFSGFIAGVPRELDEAAVLDGCTPLRLFVKVIWPLLRPPACTAAIFVFMNAWNDFQYSTYFIPRSSMYTMPQMVYKFTGFHTMEMNLVCGQMLLTCIPVIILYLCAQKFIISGISAGAVKG